MTQIKAVKPFCTSFLLKILQFLFWNPHATLMHDELVGSEGRNQAPRMGKKTEKGQKRLASLSSRTTQHGVHKFVHCIEVAQGGVGSESVRCCSGWAGGACGNMCLSRPWCLLVYSTFLCASLPPSREEGNGVVRWQRGRVIVGGYLLASQTQKKKGVQSHALQKRPLPLLGVCVPITRSSTGLRTPVL